MSSHDVLKVNPRLRMVILLQHWGYRKDFDMMTTTAIRRAFKMVQSERREIFKQLKEQTI